MKKIFIILLSVQLICTINLFSQSKNWIQEEEKARKLYESGRIDEAIILFREIILSSNNETVKRESYFWLSQAYINSVRYDQAEKNLEYYIQNYKSNGKNYAEAHYQKGRLLFLQEQYESCISQLTDYIDSFPDHRLIANAYYWIGEALYALGNFDDSALYFQIVIDKYPMSFKTEASNYKLRLIEHKKSELVLQNLLKWSQEQFISSVNKFKKRERELQEALNNKNISSSNETEIDSAMQSENQLLKDKIIQLENQIAVLQSSEVDGELIEQLKKLEMKEKMLDKKEKLLKMLEEELRKKEESLE